ncbi:hypothetical protein [Sphingobium yanoikuyae]|uniref:hypothetical protein n=1 Tax=Sphingobium yanoikuyae TaxID=13690 RepID=UPI002FD88B79
MTDAVKPAPDGVVISRELLAFLCGDGPLDGHYFGEKPEHERGNFWWRKALRAAENAALEQAGEPVDVALLDRAELAWQRFFYPAADCFTGPAGDKLPSVDLEVADCLRLVLAAVGRLVVTPEADVPAPLPTLQRLGQEFDAGEVSWMEQTGQPIDQMPDPDPDGYRYDTNIRGERYRETSTERRDDLIDEGWTETPLYAHPPQSRAAGHRCYTVEGNREAREKALTEWVRKAMRFLDLCGADATGYDKLHEEDEADRLTVDGYSLFGANVAFDSWCLADLENRTLTAFLEPKSREHAANGEEEAVIAMAAKFGPTLKAAFPSEHARTRFDVANALAEVVIKRAMGGNHE